MGIKTAVAQRLQCSRQTVDNYLDRFPDLQEALDQERESIVDLAESKLVKAVHEGSLRAVLFVLETMGKERGWTKRTEVVAESQLSLPQEVLAFMDEHGLELSDVVREFNALIVAQAAMTGDED